MQASVSLFNYLTTMKKMILTFAGSLLIGMSALFAQQQQDSTRNQNQNQNQSQSYRNMPNKSDMVMVKTTEIPASLRATLQSDEYSGWENGTVYRTKNNDQYLVEIKDGDQTKTYRFDKNGKPLREY